jgi:hypothetical protein
MIGVTLDRNQRTALCEELQHDLQDDVPEIEIAFTQQRYNDAQQLRWDYEAIFRLMTIFRGGSRAAAASSFR